MYSHYIEKCTIVVRLKQLKYKATDWADSGFCQLKHAYFCLYPLDKRTLRGRNSLKMSASKASVIPCMPLSMRLNDGRGR